MTFWEAFAQIIRRVGSAITLKRCVVGGFFLVFLFIFCSQVVILSLAKEIHSVTSTPSAPVALVFGAGLKPNGKPSDALYDRIEVGAELYKEGKVEKIIMTGDNGSRLYNEVVPMQETAEALGVPKKDIILDYAGFRSYDSCYRARDVFGVTSTIVVSQKFHVPRILFICRALGIKTEGVGADKHIYNEAGGYWPVREFLARVKAFTEVVITRPKPKFLGEREVEWQNN